MRTAKFGYFGASTGAAAALVAAAEMQREIQAIVSRGGRPDLAGGALQAVTAPILLIMGGNDELVIGMNQDALSHLRCEKKMVIVPGATNSPRSGSSSTSHITSQCDGSHSPHMPLRRQWLRR